MSIVFEIIGLCFLEYKYRRISFHKRMDSIETSSKKINRDVWRDGMLGECVNFLKASWGRNKRVLAYLGTSYDLLVSVAVVVCGTVFITGDFVRQSYYRGLFYRFRFYNYYIPDIYRGIGIAMVSTGGLSFLVSCIQWNILCFEHKIKYRLVIFLNIVILISLVIQIPPFAVILEEVKNNLNTHLWTMFDGYRTVFDYANSYRYSDEWNALFVHFQCCGLTTNSITIRDPNDAVPWNYQRYYMYSYGGYININAYATLFPNHCREKITSAHNDVATVYHDELVPDPVHTEPCTYVLEDLIQRYRVALFVLYALLLLSKIVNCYCYGKLYLTKQSSEQGEPSTRIFVLQCFHHLKYKPLYWLKRSRIYIVHSIFCIISFLISIGLFIVGYLFKYDKIFSHDKIKPLLQYLTIDEFGSTSLHAVITIISICLMVFGMLSSFIMMLLIVTPLVSSFKSSFMMFVLLFACLVSDLLILTVWAHLKRSIWNNIDNVMENGIQDSFSTTDNTVSSFYDGVNFAWNFLIHEMQCCPAKEVVLPTCHNYGNVEFATESYITTFTQSCKTAMKDKMENYDVPGLSLLSILLVAMIGLCVLLDRSYKYMKEETKDNKETQKDENDAANEKRDGSKVELDKKEKRGSDALIGGMQERKGLLFTLITEHKKAASVLCHLTLLTLNIGYMIGFLFLNDGGAMTFANTLDLHNIKEETMIMGHVADGMFILLLCTMSITILLCPLFFVGIKLKKQQFVIADTIAVLSLIIIDFVALGFIARILDVGNCCTCSHYSSVTSEKTLEQICTSGFKKSINLSAGLTITFLLIDILIKSIIIVFNNMVYRVFNTNDEETAMFRKFYETFIKGRYKEAAFTVGYLLLMVMNIGYMITFLLLNSGGKRTFASTLDLHNINVETLNMGHLADGIFYFVTCTMSITLLLCLITFVGIKRRSQRLIWMGAVAVIILVLLNIFALGFTSRILDVGHCCTCSRYRSISSEKTLTQMCTSDFKRSIYLRAGLTVAFLLIDTTVKIGLIVFHNMVYKKFASTDDQDGMFLKFWKTHILGRLFKLAIKLEVNRKYLVAYLILSILAMNLEFMAMVGAILERFSPGYLQTEFLPLLNDFYKNNAGETKLIYGYLMNGIMIAVVVLSPIYILVHLGWLFLIRFMGRRFLYAGTVIICLICLIDIVTIGLASTLLHMALNCGTTSNDNETSKNTFCTYHRGTMVKILGVFIGFNLLHLILQVLQLIMSTMISLQVTSASKISPSALSILQKVENRSSPQIEEGAGLRETSFNAENNP